MRSLALVLLAAAACGDNASTSTTLDAAKSTDAPKVFDDAPPSVAGTITLNGGANDLLWDAASSTLYFTDENAATLAKWTDAGGVQVVGNLPAFAVGASPNPGGLIKLADGTIVTLEFGAGTTGRLEEVTAAGVGTAYTGLDPLVKYLDLELADDGTIYATGFKGNSTTATGRIYTLVLDRTAHTVVPTEILGPETVAMEQLKKIVGLVVTSDTLYLSDQTSHAILKYPRTALTPQSTVATVATGDFLFQLPDGDLLTGGGNVINRVKTSDGTVSTVDVGSVSLGTVHGLAYDSAKHRLFALDHSSTAGAMDVVHIIPLAE